MESQYVIIGSNDCVYYASDDKGEALAKLAEARAMDPAESYTLYIKVF